MRTGVTGRIRGYIPPDSDSVEGNKISFSRITALNSTFSAVSVWCRCGARGKANPRTVGKSRKIDQCVECR